MKPKTFRQIQSISQFRPARNRVIGNSMLAFLSTIALSQATIIDFDLSPAATSAALGLSPANEVPAVTSTGSGNAVSGGTTFDTTTSTLSFAMGYGSSSGFTDLTGAATGLHIHGPAAAGANAAVIFNLAPVHFPAADPTKGGIIYGSVVYTPAQATALLAGLNYVNIHTAANSNGEIRGQLVRVNTAPEIISPASATIECGPPATYSATVSDVDGEAVQVVWTLNGAQVETDRIPAGGPPTSAVVEYTARLPLGVNTLAVTATDSNGNVTMGSSTITVVDNTDPVIVSTSVRPKVLWPANHKLVPVRVDVKVTDNCSATTWRIISVTSNQAVGSRGSGKTSPDWRITDDHTVLLRAERSGKDKTGRIYTITVQATDKAGNKSKRSTVRVTVPHDKGKKS